MARRHRFVEQREARGSENEWQHAQYQIALRLANRDDGQRFADQPGRERDAGAQQHGARRQSDEVNDDASRQRSPAPNTPDQIDFALDGRNREARRHRDERDRDAGQPCGLLREPEHIFMDDRCGAAGQHVLEDEAFERGKPTFEHRKAGNKRECDRCHRDDGEQCSER